MDLIIYLDKRVHVVLLEPSGYYYVGKVISVDDSSLSLIDKNGKQVSINKANISFIKEMPR
jgi:hypothetical protein